MTKAHNSWRVRRCEVQVFLLQGGLLIVQVLTGGRDGERKVVVRTWSISYEILGLVRGELGSNMQYVW